MMDKQISCTRTALRTLLAGASLVALAMTATSALATMTAADLVLVAQGGHGGQGAGRHAGDGGRGGADSRGHSSGGGHVSGEDAILHSGDDHGADSHESGDHVDVLAASDGGRGQGAGGQGGGQGVGGQGGERGAGGRQSMEDRIIDGEEEEDSDRPDWAGPGATGEKPGSRNPNPGIAKGDLYGDLYIILRDVDGVPILTEEGYVQPIDAEGNPIPLDEEGEVPEEYADLLQEVDFGRLNVGRSPDRVLENRLEEAIANLNLTETVISVDASGRLTYVVDGEEKAIDSPLENLGLYLDLMDDGVIDGLTATLDPTLSSLVNEGLSNDDLMVAASLFAAAADKTGMFTVDEIVYMNAILGVTGTDPIIIGDESYVRYDSFTYDREVTWDGLTVEVLVYDPETETWSAESQSIYDVVFEGLDAGGSNIAGFTQAADDALQVIEFVHEYTVPIIPTTETLAQ